MIGEKQIVTKDSTYNVTYLKFDTTFTKFKKVSIPIVNPNSPGDTLKYFYNGFEFRFRNYETISNTYLPAWRSGLGNIWNLDYVYLRVGGSAADTVLIDTTMQDVAIKDYRTTLLKDYQSMPWKQFKANPSSEMDTAIVFPYHNFSKSNLNVYQLFQVANLCNHQSGFITIPDTSVNGKMLPFTDSYFYPKISNYNYTTNYVSDCSNNNYANFEVRTIINSNSIKDMDKYNDTCRFVQRFYNYLCI